MPRLIWSPEALKDIQFLHQFLVSKNRNAAKKAVTAIRQGVGVLKEYPEAGRPVGELPPEFREWPIGFGARGYVALYRVDDDEVIILAVRHGSESGY